MFLESAMLLSTVVRSLITGASAFLNTSLGMSSGPVALPALSFFITLIPHNVREVGMYPAVEAKIRSPCLIGMSCHRYVCQVLFHYKWNF